MLSQTFKYNNCSKTNSLKCKFHLLKCCEPKVAQHFLGPILCISIGAQRWNRRGLAHRVLRFPFSDHPPTGWPLSLPVPRRREPANRKCGFHCGGEPRTRRLPRPSPRESELRSSTWNAYRSQRPHRSRYRLPRPRRAAVHQSTLAGWPQPRRLSLQSPCSAAEYG